MKLFTLLILSVFSVCILHSMQSADTAQSIPDYSKYLNDIRADIKAAHKQFIEARNIALYLSIKPDPNGVLANTSIEILDLIHSYLLVEHKTIADLRNHGKTQLYKIGNLCDQHLNFHIMTLAILNNQIPKGILISLQNDTTTNYSNLLGMINSKNNGSDKSHQDAIFDISDAVDKKILSMQ